VSEWLSDLGARFRQDRERARARRLAVDEAISAGRSVSAGKSKDEVRELLAAELLRRDITPPGEPILSHLADQVLADEDVLTRLRLAGRGLGILADLGVKLTRDVKERFRAGGLDMDLGDAEPLFVRFDPSRAAAPVLLDADAQLWFDASTDPESRPGFSEIFVVLSWAGPGHDGGQATVRAGDRRVGVLTAADSQDFRPYLDEGMQQKRPVVTEAALERTPDATWRLTVYRPGTS
jgi:hypothetical protein